MNEYKKALDVVYGPLVDLVLKKKVKKKKDIHALSMKPPMGLRPDDVTPEIGTRFVKMFIPLAWNAVKDKSMKKTMKSLRTLFQESKDEGAFKVSKASQEKKVQSPVIAAKTPSAPIASTVPEKQLKEMMNQGFSQHSSEMWYSAFEMLDPSGKGSIDETCLSTFFSQFGEKLEQGEAEFILSKLKRSRGKKVEEKDEEKKKKSVVGLVDFATFMNAKMKTSPSVVASHHQPRFGAAFDLFTQNGSMMTSDHIQKAMAILQEPVTMEVRSLSLSLSVYVCMHVHDFYSFYSMSRKRQKWQQRPRRSRNL